MIIEKIKNSLDPYSELLEILDTLHRIGPIDGGILEKLSYYKEFHSEVFTTVEEQIISALGLFYKVKSPNNLYSFLLSAFGDQHKKEFGEFLTPVQASVRRAIESKQFVSISAPTSAGKSYSIRDFIADQVGDAVVIVPSRALIAEYVNTMKRKFNGDKGVMISAFVDNIFTSRNLRRIFVLTPERARDLFLSNLKLNIRVFFFDEAQVSEEKIRGIMFDVLVRRIQKIFPLAKLIFAHPFVDNPDAQFKKHNISSVNSYARSYTHGAVGKLCIHRHANGRTYYFSPYIESGHTLKNCSEFHDGFEAFAFNGDHSILIYVSKASIYNGTFIENFQSHIDTFTEITHPEATEIIDTVEHLLGADQSDHKSRMVSLLKKGIVIHHGSVPLEVRFLLEDFIRGGFAKICFATSTLAQGVNMPFDIVWLDNMRFLGDGDDDKSLAFKNLIGRSGRLSTEQRFDYGYVYTANPKLFIERINNNFKLNEKSVIDLPLDNENSDSKELIDSIKDETFDDDLHLPTSKAERLIKAEVLANAKRILDIIYRPGGTIKDNIGGQSNLGARTEVVQCFKFIFEVALDRDLYDGEIAVFETAINLFIQSIQGKSFREIVGGRYSYLSRRDEGKNGTARFSQPANKLPDSKLKRKFSLFPNIPAREVSYDAIVFDTYDYMDQVVSFSLSDTFTGTFKIYLKRAHDPRAEKIIELLRFGTNNVVHTLLMRYGFPPEDVAEITPYIQSINEANIIFNKNIDDAPAYIRQLADWYRS